MKVLYSEEKKQWEVLPEGSKEGFYLDGKLKQKLDTIKAIQKKNWDCVFMIDGMEGSGKSTLGRTCAWYLSDCKFTKDNYCLSAQDAIKKLGTFPDESVLIVDEGDLAFSSRKIFDVEQNRLIQLIKIIRFKKMVLIIIAPTFFDLSRGISVRRSRFLLHVYTDKQLTRGRFCYFGEKKKHKLYELGKKNYSSYARPRSDFIGRFTDFNPIGSSYDDMKQALVDGIVEHKSKMDLLLNKRLLILQYKLSQIPKKCAITQKELAKVIGYDAKMLYEWERIPQKHPEILDKLQKNSEYRTIIL